MCKKKISTLILIQLIQPVIRVTSNGKPSEWGIIVCINKKILKAWNQQFRDALASSN